MLINAKVSVINGDMPMNDAVALGTQDTSDTGHRWEYYPQNRNKAGSPVVYKVSATSNLLFSITLITGT